MHDLPDLGAAGIEQLLGRPLGEAVPELRQQGFEMLLDGVFASGETSIGRDAPAEFERPGGGPETFYFDFVYTPLREVHGEVAGILVVGNDVTAQVIARRDVEGLRAGAESANRAKDEFLAMLGHELRNPLAPILTALQLLKLRGIQAGERERDIIERQVRTWSRSSTTCSTCRASRVARSSCGASPSRSPTSSRAPSRWRARCSSSSATTCASTCRATG